MVALAAKRQAVAHLQATLGMSERRAEQPKVQAMRSIVGMAAEGCTPPVISSALMRDNTVGLWSQLDERLRSPGVTYNLITASGGIDGIFSTMNKAETVLGFLRHTDTQLQLLGTFLAPTGTSVQTGQAIDYVNSVLVAGTGSAALTASRNADTLLFGLLTTEAYASASQLSFEHGLALAKAARGGMVMTHSDEAGLFVFGQGPGNRRDLDGDAAIGTSAVDIESYGIFGGVGFGNANASIGVFAGKLDSRQDIRGLNARTDADGLVAGIAGRLVASGFDLGVLLTNDWSKAETSRAVPGGRVTGAYDLHALTLDVSAGYSVPLAQGWAIRPGIGVTHISTSREASRETGSAVFGYGIETAKSDATFADASVRLAGGQNAGAAIRPWLEAGVR